MTARSPPTEMVDTAVNTVAERERPGPTLLDASVNSDVVSTGEQQTMTEVPPVLVKDMLATSTMTEAVVTEDSEKTELIRRCDQLSEELKKDEAVQSELRK